MSEEPLLKCTVLYKYHGHGGRKEEGVGTGSAGSHSTAPDSGGLEKHLSTIKRPASDTHSNMDGAQP